MNLSKVHNKSLNYNVYKCFVCYNVRICEHVVGLNLALGRNLFSVLRDIELSLTTNW